MTSRLDPERWRALSSRLDEALDLSGERREAWLASLRLEDRRLAEDLESALDDHGAILRAGFLERDSPFDADPASGTAGSLAGLSLGAYTLRSPIGQGGMGSVWLAERSDGRYRGTAAVKLLNASLVGGEGEARFRREGEILARLRHPHIARLLDAGVSPVGQPYLVLEHVDGAPIDLYCDRLALSVAARVRLLLDVLDAVAHAHSNLIVHRDLKPSNVLVTRGGEVKLLDFGIAKLLDPQEVGEAWAPTREGHAALTPLYAAPEQLTGGHVTTATDVYALGALLYQLLCGRHPSAGAGASAAELIRSIVETEPPRPSDVATSAPAGGGPTAAETAEEMAELRSTTPGRLHALLRGDLDNIALKALAKRVEHRYPSAEALADDLRRYAGHQPVSARPQGAAYRLGKFVRRNRGGVAAGGLVALALLAGSAGIAWQAREARTQRDVALAQLARASASNEFLAFLLSVAAPGGERFSVGELLEQGELLIERQFETDEVLRAEMLVAIGQQYMISERWDRAQPALERAAELARRSTDPALRARALCHLAALIGATRSVAEARSLIEEALAGLPGGALWDLQRAECTVGLANLGFFTDDSAPMIRNAELARDLFDRAPVVSATGRIDAHAALAYGYYLAHQNRRADREYELLLDELTRLGRERTLAAASLFNNWALVHYLGDLERAEPMTRRAVELRRAIEGASVGPTALFNHAGVLFQLGRWQEAEPLLEETIRTAAARRETRIELDATIELAGVYLATGRLDQAEQTLRQVEARSEDPRFHEWRRSHLAYYRGRLAQARGEHGAARERFAEAVEIYARRKSKIAMSVLALIGLAESDGALGRPAAAAGAAGEALALAEGFVEPEQPSYLVGLARLALSRALQAQGEVDAARESLEIASRHLAATLGEEHPATRAALAERER